jgi:hypothetical protein
VLPQAPKRLNDIAPAAPAEFGSLIPETLKDMEADTDFKLTADMLKKFGQKKLTLEEKKKRRRALDNLGLPEFVEKVESLNTTRLPAEVFQMNIGLYCNQACR